MPKKKKKRKKKKDMFEDFASKFKSKSIVKREIRQFMKRG